MYSQNPSIPQPQQLCLTKRQHIKSPALGKSQQRTSLQQLLACQICYCKALQPTLCPHCSKLFCTNCLTTTLKIKPECPNCRQFILGPLTNCTRFLNELSIIVCSLIENEEKVEKCREHAIDLNYYCLECQRSACCECKMFGKHQNHSFKSISQIYEQRHQKIRDLLSSLKAGVMEQEQALLGIENDLIAVRQLTEVQLAQIQDFGEKYRHKVAVQTASHTNKESETVECLRKTLQQLHSLKEELLQRSEQAKKSHCYRQDRTLFDSIQLCLARCKELVSSSKKTQVEQALPPYCKQTVKVYPFSYLSGCKPTVTEEMVYQGSRWRLVVYLQPPNSCSVFLQLLQNPDQLKHYEYWVQVVRPGGEGNIVKEHRAEFEVGESLGYTKLVKQNLNEFVDVEKDELSIVMGVRLCYYYQLYQRRQNLLDKLDRQLTEHDRQIQQLEQANKMVSNDSIVLE